MTVFFTVFGIVQGVGYRPFVAGLAEEAGISGFVRNCGGIVEINAAPGLRMHLQPSYGKGRAVGEAIVASMFADGDDARIPVVAVTGRVSSEGELGDRGLAPRRFDGEQRVAFRSRRWSMQFEPERVKLPEGREAATLPGVQDEASLFVQLTWIFTTQPQLLKVGQTIEIPLALPRRVEVWQYDVIAEETLQLPFAEVSTLHVKPRRPPRPGGDMTAQIWFAPGLQYLPVRILIHQDPQTFVDLVLKRPPQQAAQR